MSQESQTRMMAETSQSVHCTVWCLAVANPKILKEGGRKTVYQLRHHLSQMPFYKGKDSLLKKIMSQ